MREREERERYTLRERERHTHSEREPEREREREIMKVVKHQFRNPKTENGIPRLGKNSIANNDENIQ